MSILFKKIFKIVLSIVPITLATWIYTKIINKTPLKHIVNYLIKSTIPNNFKIDEGIIILNREDTAVSGMIALNTFEPYQTKLFREIIKENMVVIDIGANIGYYTIIAGKRVGPNGKVFSFEPEQNNFTFLNKNIKENNLINVRANQIALSNKTGKQNLFLSPENTGTYSLVDNRKTNQSVSVTTETLDNILRKNNVSSVDLIKMDIEGGECIAIEGMKNTISNSPNLIIMTEFFPNAIRRFGKDPIKFLDIFTNYGFKLFEINEDKKELIPILDNKKFVDNFPKGEVATNIYAVKR